MERVRDVDAQALPQELDKPLCLRRKQMCFGHHVDRDWLSHPDNIRITGRLAVGAPGMTRTERAVSSVWEMVKPAIFRSS